MSYAVIMLIVLWVLTILEFSASGNEKLQKNIFHLAFAFACVWCGIKYAIGPDIVSYIPEFQSLKGLPNDLSLLSESNFERGYTLFCSILRTFGLSFWWLSTLVSLLFCWAIWELLKRAKTSKTFLLFLIFLVCHDMVLIQFRQCLAVTFFIFCTLKFQKKSYIWAAILAIIAISMHKSALAIVALTAVFYLFRHTPTDKICYLLLLLILVGFCAIPLSDAILAFAQSLHLDQNIVESLEYHLQGAKSWQRIYVLYVATIVCVAHFSQREAKNQKWHWMMWGCWLIICCLGQYWIILGRIRNYFIPFVAVYLANLLHENRPSDQLFKQSYTAFVLLYASLTIISTVRAYNTNQYPTENVSTIFERLNHSRQELEQRQMRQAKLYWEHDFRQTFDSEK